MFKFFQHLPKEMHLQILEFLSALDLTTAAQVSKDWDQLSNDRPLWIELLKKISRYEVKTDENPKQIYRLIIELKKKSPDELLNLIKDTTTTAELIISTPGLLDIIDISTLAKIMSPYLDDSAGKSEWVYFLAYEMSKTIVATQPLLEKVSNDNNILQKIVTKDFHAKHFLNNPKLFEKLDRNDLYQLLFSFLDNHAPSEEEVEIYLSEENVQQKLGNDKLTEIFINFPEYVGFLKTNPTFLPLFSENHLYSIINAFLDDACKNMDEVEEELENSNSLEDLSFYQTAEDQFVVAFYLLLKLAQRTTELDEDKLIEIVSLEKILLLKINVFFTEDAKYLSLPASDAENLLLLFIKLFNDTLENIEISRQLILTCEDHLDNIESYQTAQKSYDAICQTLLNLARTNNKLIENNLDVIFNLQLVFLKATNSFANEIEERPAKFQKLM